MKKYDPKVAAQRLVRLRVEHGLSRHAAPERAKTRVTSVLTERAHVQALTGYAKFLKERSGKHLKNARPEDSIQYLEQLAVTRRQSTVSLARQAINLHLHFERPLAFVRSQVPTIPVDRAYTEEQILLLQAEASPRLGLSIALAADAGLREMELLTLTHPVDLAPSRRQWDQARFLGREHTAPFIVAGKGGLIREVRLSPQIADQLATTARSQALRVKHRGAHLASRFDVVGGHQFSIEFGRLSNRVLGFSKGAHGLRHSFAQRRRDELLCLGMGLDEAIRVLSQELGHFATKNTMAYLRDQLARPDRP